MKTLYTLSIYVVGFALKIIALFNKKLKLFVEGRKNLFPYLQENIQKGERYVWVHTASLGEFEQGLPVIKALKNRGKKILVTFFSPSGYEIRKNSPDADLVVYLPLDTPKNARKFLEIVQPEMAIFVKYEFWYHYLNELKNRGIKTYLLSGIFRENQIFFKPYGAMMRDCLRAFHHFFVQNEKSKKLLQSIGFENITVSGDTRFDRVSEILKRDNSLDFMEAFKGNSLCVVFGSSWESDEEIYLKAINYSDNKNVKYVIAPHDIKPEKIDSFRRKIALKTVFFSEKEGKNLSEYDVLILDTIGILTKVYSYADVAYVGGGMGNSGLHNVLEPAVFGIPVVIGKNYDKFAEAKELVEMGGVISVSTEKELEEKLSLLIQNPDKRAEIGKINADFVKKNSGATYEFLEIVFPS
ncbi:3-deoxy-D-manno-octulosonic acid transferase [Capnocytophaga stomatis]|uniref:3-deoxy-D-manno-octulosonic acid transferase n=1 Tax=Capnocytophaga stomatis TaxID=1848904 RepID=UPI00194DEF39|nr:glycosyltransferase N-terminal domain-containing protein [Capnocytophaga stomatis]GIJ97535.1 3-deoxy-D-manno-octulosonic acid transferase [Capnocytophaga stomatis]GIM50077.1 3-deoxy-D-manno-octulosonic acid transferase [Capnocytophaga stomatis]